MKDDLLLLLLLGESGSSIDCCGYGANR